MKFYLYLGKNNFYQDYIAVQQSRNENYILANKFDSIKKAHSYWVLLGRPSVLYLWHYFKEGRRWIRIQDCPYPIKWFKGRNEIR